MFAKSPDQVPFWQDLSRTELELSQFFFIINDKWKLFGFGIAGWTIWIHTEISKQAYLHASGHASTCSSTFSPQEGGNEKTDAHWYLSFS